MIHLASPEMILSMGDEYAEQGKYDEALDQYFKVLEHQQICI
jgi:hypothetical protein